MARVSKKAEACAYDTGSFGPPTARGVIQRAGSGAMVSDPEQDYWRASTTNLFGGKPSARGATLIKKSGLTLHSTYGGTGKPVNTLTLTAFKLVLPDPR